MDTDKINSFQIAQIYGNANVGGCYPGNIDETGGSTSADMPAPVFTDLYKRNRIVTPDGVNIRVGSPILYFKAKNTDVFDFELSKEDMMAIDSFEQGTGYLDPKDARFGLESY